MYAPGFGIHARAEHESGGLLGDDDAGVFHRVGQPAQRLAHAVLHVDGRQVDVAGNVKRHGNLAGAVVAAGGRDVLHSRNAVDGLFQRNRHRGFHRLRVRTDVAAGNHHLRRRQIRELRNRKSRNRDRAAEHDQQRADCREHRPLNEKIDKQIRSPPSLERLTPCSLPELFQLYFVFAVDFGSAAVQYPYRCLSLVP